MSYLEFADLKSKLANNLKHIREEKSVTQEELADSILVSRQTIANIEDNDCFVHHSYFNLYKIAKYFSITMDELLHGLTTMPDEVRLLYRIKKLSPIERSMIEAYLITRNK
jgi:DNA-binding XRE family transcriptional regulator